MDTFKDRIKKIRGDLTYEQFGVELTKSGFPFAKGNLWKYENDDSLRPSFAFFYAVAIIFKINLNWLIVGEGPMKISYGMIDKKIDNKPENVRKVRKHCS